jgi:hypothetical protein
VGIGVLGSASKQDVRGRPETPKSRVIVNGNVTQRRTSPENQMVPDSVRLTGVIE